MAQLFYERNSTLLLSLLFVSVFLTIVVLQPFHLISKAPTTVKFENDNSAILDDIDPSYFQTDFIIDSVPIIKSFRIMQPPLPSRKEAKQTNERMAKMKPEEIDALAKSDKLRFQPCAEENGKIFKEAISFWQQL